MLQASRLDVAGAPAFDELVEACGPVFLSARWRRALGDGASTWVLADGGGDPVGGFLLYRERRQGLGFLRNPPFTPFVGPFLNLRASNPAARAARCRAAAEVMLEVVRAERASVINLALEPGWVDLLPFTWAGFKTSPSYTHRIDLAGTEEALWAALSSDRRKSIRRAAVDGVEIAPCDDPSVILRLAAATFARKGLRRYRGEMERILEHFVGSDQAMAFTARRDGVVIGCAFCVHDRTTAYYLMGGVDPERRHHGAVAGCLWAAIREAKRRGVLVFDFEGSSVPEIERFFRGFGGVLTHVPRVARAALPIEVLLKLRYRDVF